MEQNQQNLETPADNIPGIGNTSFEITLSQPYQSTNSSSAGTLISGAALRKSYIYTQRDEFIYEHGRVPQDEFMEVVKQEALKLYPKDGDYIIKDGVVIYLGIA